jgi:hypothetical protein
MAFVTLYIPSVTGPVFTAKMPFKIKTDAPIIERIRG